MLSERERIGHEGMIDVPFERAAAEAGSPLYANSVAFGVISGLFRRDPDAPSGAIESYFGSKSNEVRAMNVAACRRGSEIGQRIKAERGFGPVACADHRIACYAAPLVPISVERKLCSLMDRDIARFAESFEVIDLPLEVWTSIRGLEVMPLAAPRRQHRAALPGIRPDGVPYVRAPRRHFLPRGARPHGDR